jgi:hypothetical protein
MFSVTLRCVFGSIWTVWPWRWRHSDISKGREQQCVNMPEDLNLQQYRCKYLKSSYYTGCYSDSELGPQDVTIGWAWKLARVRGRGMCVLANTCKPTTWKTVCGDLIWVQYKSPLCRYDGPRRSLLREVTVARCSRNTLHFMKSDVQYRLHKGLFWDRRTQSTFFSPVPSQSISILFFQRRLCPPSCPSRSPSIIMKAFLTFPMSTTRPVHLASLDFIILITLGV